MTVHACHKENEERTARSAVHFVSDKSQTKGKCYASIKHWIYPYHERGSALLVAGRVGTGQGQERADPQCICSSSTDQRSEP